MQPLFISLVTTEVATDVGLVRVTYVGAFCMDTGRHHVEIRTKQGRAILRDMLTLDLFEEDLDGDGTKELYLLSIQTCNG